uniref:Uncharacterized protein n=1 Tax=Arundo donax TaxID=35708 RepID=A0A0A9D6X3_ARUDO
MEIVVRAILFHMFALLQSILPGVAEVLIIPVILHLHLPVLIPPEEHLFPRDPLHILPGSDVGHRHIRKHVILVIVDEAGEELVLVGLAEGVVLPMVLHELLDALEDEL